MHSKIFLYGSLIFIAICSLAAATCFGYAALGQGTFFKENIILSTPNEEFQYCGDYINFSSEEYKIEEGQLALGDYIVVEPTEKQLFDSGLFTNSIKYKILNANGQDVTSSYNIKEKLLQPHNSLFSFIIWFLFSFILFSVWMNFDTTWLKVGDAQWYSTSYKIWNGNHIFDINNYAINQTFTPRAYITGIIPYIAYLISFQNIPLYYYIYFIFAAFSISLFMNIIIPKIYELLSGKKPAFIQTQVFALIFFFYWWNYIYDFIVDVYAVLFLSLAFMSYLLFKQKQKMSYIVLAGICLSLSILYRNSYVIFLYLLCFIFIIQLFRVKFISIFHKNYLFILFFIIGIIIPCIPQIYISYIHDGIFSLYGYDKVGVYTSPTQTLSSELTSWSLYNITGWPWVLPNGIMLSHLNNIMPFSDAKEMNIAMVLLTYFSNMFSALFVLININYLNISLVASYQNTKSKYSIGIFSLFEYSTKFDSH